MFELQFHETFGTFVNNMTFWGRRSQKMNAILAPGPFQVNLSSKPCPPQNSHWNTYEKRETKNVEFSWIFNTRKKQQLPAAPSQPLFISFPISSWLLLLILIRLHKFFAEKSILAIPAIGNTKIRNFEIRLIGDGKNDEKLAGSGDF